MLEKMGWSKGKGLGANLDGSLNFIKVAHKDNQKGMGFKDRDDQWTQHEDNFNALLKSFETGSGSSAGSEEKNDADDSSGEFSGRVGFGFKSAEPKPTKESLFSGNSLEEQSKKSRSRVHYKKFTRGKDMARYSEQDLANIFGKRSLGDKHAHAVEAEELAASKDQDNETPDDTEEKTFGVTVIKTGLSVTDYFKAKMEAMQANRKGPDGAKSSNPFYVYQPEKVTLNFAKEEENADATPIESSSNIVSKKKKRNREEVDREEEPAQESEEPKVKKSKKKKSKQSDEEVILVENGSEELNETILEKSVPEKKKLKNKSKENQDELIEESNPPQEISENKKSKKKFKQTVDEIPLVVDLSNEEPLPIQEAKDKKKKSKKHPTEVPNQILVEVDEPNIELVPKKTKKSKKSKHQEVENEPILIADDDSLETSSPAKRKKSKKSREVIKTQPLHFPKFVSNLLTSLYDPHITDLGQSSLEPEQTPSQPTPATSSSSSTPATTSEEPTSSTNLQDTFELARSKAEVFRFFDLAGYNGATLEDIVGYGYSRNIQLKVVATQRDDARITNFWDLALVNKYGADVVKIKKQVKKKRFNIKSLEKKNVFKF